MRLWIRVICSRMRELSTSIAFFIDSNLMFLINTCNGWQRVATQCKFRQYNNKHLFLQNYTPECFGGAPGYYHNAAEANAEKAYTLEIHGPPGLYDYMHVFTHAYGGLTPHWRVHEMVGSAAEEAKKPGVEDRTERCAEIDGKIKVIPIPMEGVIGSLSYIVQPSPPRPKFKGELAKKMGLKGAQIRELVNGHDVTLPDGKVVLSSEMNEKAPESVPAAIFLYVQSAEHIRSLIKNLSLHDYFAKEPGKKSVKSAGIIYHNASIDILKDPTYLDYLAQFGKEPLHILDCKELIDDFGPRTDSHHFVKLLHVCNSKLFPDLPLEPIHRQDPKLLEQIMEEFRRRGMTAKVALMGGDYGFSPALTTPTGTRYPTIKGENLEDVDDFVKVKKIIEGTPALAELKRQCETAKPSRQFRNEPRFVFLGTASQRCSKRRGLSSIYINVPGMFGAEKFVGPEELSKYYMMSFGILADCGEGSFGQLLDHFHDADIVTSILCNLRVIFITHYHGDHSFGLAQVLEEADKALLRSYKPSDQATVAKESPLFLAIPRNMEAYCKMTIKLSCPHFPQRIRLVQTNMLNPDPKLYYAPQKKKEDITAAAAAAAAAATATVPIEVPSLTERQADEFIGKLYKNPAQKEAAQMWDYLRSYMGISRLHSVEVDHAPETYGMMLSGPDWKVAYSGDTVPCKTLENYARGMDLLIHECTLGDGESKTEGDPKHTRMSEVVEVAKRLHPWRTVLTHFSNRDRRIVVMSEAAKAAKLFPAYDHLRFSLSDADWMHATVPLFEAVINNEE